MDLFLFLTSSAIILITTGIVFKSKINRLEQRLNIQVAKNQRLELEHKKDLVRTALSYQELERKKVSQDIHDSLNSLLLTAKINIVTGLKDLPNGVANEHFSLAKLLLDEALSLSHGISHSLTPTTVERFGLVNATEDLCARISTGRMKIIFSQSGFSEKLTSDRDIQIYRVLQEVLNNYIKHSTATVISLQLNGGPIIMISIFDNGAPFNLLSSNSNSGLGLVSIQNRLETLGASMKSESGPPVNTLEIFIPLRIAPK